MQPNTENTKNETEKPEGEEPLDEAEKDGEEFRITIKKLELPVRPRGVLAE